MRRQLFTLGAVAMVAIVLASPALAQNRGATFTPIGLFPMCDQVPEGEFCENFPLTTAVSMTADGQTVAGMHAFFSGAYVWTAETGVQTLGPVSGAPYIARDGSALASDPYLPPDYLVDQNSYWTGGFYPDATWDPIPNADDYVICGNSAQGVFGISDDGATTVGLTWIDFDMNGNGCDGARAYSTVNDVVTVLDDSLFGGSRANAVNADGSVVVGFMQTNSRNAAKWVNGVQEFLCPDPSFLGGANFCPEGMDVTPDGSLMLTQLQDINVDFNTRATLVDQAGNTEQMPFPDAPFDPFWDSWNARAVSDDGNTVVGSFGGDGGFFGSPPYPVLWNRDLGFTLDIQVFLLGQGLDDLFFWFLSDASAVNGDGTIIAGQGTNPDGWIEAWHVDLSKVKVCHKPDGNGTGNERTIAIAWGSVPDHLAHGDFLATCEFGAADGHSRAMSTRRMMVGANDDPNRGHAIPSMEDVNRAQQRVGESNPFGTFGAVHAYPTTQEEGDAASGQSSEQRDSIRKRVERSRSQR